MSNGTQITDMTVTAYPLPTGTFAPIAVTDPATGLSALVSYRYDLGADLLTRPTFAALAASGGSNDIGFLQAGTGAVARTLQSKDRDWVSVKDFGATGNGTTNDTAAIQAAINTNKRVYMPEGTYIVDAISLPGGAGNHGLELIGAGHTRTILQASATNQTILQVASGVCQHGHIGHFSLKAHASGSSGPAFDQSGFRNVRFDLIMGLSNGTAGFNSLFQVSASPRLTYGCVWENCGLAEQTGWTNVWLFNNGGAGSASNSNANTIISPWIYANTGLTYGIDAVRSAKVNIIGGLIESNSSATGIRSGNGMLIQGVWFEANAADISYAALADGASNGGQVQNCYFSSAHTVSFTGVVANVWLNNTEVGAQAWSNNDGTNVKVAQIGAVPAAPTLARSGGATGNPSLVAGTVKTPGNLLGEFPFDLRYAVTPGAATYQTEALTVPSGYAIKTISVGAIDDTTHVPATSSVGPDADLTTFSIGFATTNAHSINVHGVLRAS